MAKMEGQEGQKYDIWAYGMKTALCIDNQNLPLIDTCLSIYLDIRFLSCLSVLALITVYIHPVSSKQKYFSLFQLILGVSRCMPDLPLKVCI